VDGGRLLVSHEAAVGYLEQTATGGSTSTVLEEARSRMAATHAAQALAAAEAAAARAAPADAAAAAAQLQAARDAYEAAGGAGAEKRVAAVLDGLGFSRQRWEARCSELSGGWQMRVALARLLLSPAGDASSSTATGLLLLDEPSNHLDAAASAWLAKWLRASASAVVLVSHDAALLESSCTRLVEVRGRTLHSYTGGYARFLESRRARSEAQLQRAERQEKEAEKLEGFITRFGAKATKASAAKSKEKALARLNAEREDEDELLAAASAAASAGPGDASRVRLRLPPPPPCAEEALSLSGAAFAWAGGEAGGLADVSLTLVRGSRVVVVGPNGAGKSTLLAALAGTLPLRRGERRAGEGAYCAVFRQDLAQELPASALALDHVTDAARAYAPDTTAERVRGVLGALGLRGDAVLRPIAQLSGGEKARVALAALVLAPAPILLLDEPTNHSDAAGIAAIAEALQAWTGGCSVVVTHNCEFAVNLQPTHLVSVSGGRARMVALSGALSEADWDSAVAAANAASVATAAPTAAAVPMAAAAAPAAGSFEARKRLKSSKARLEKVMSRIEAAEAESGALDSAIAAAFERRDADGAAKAVAKKERLANEVEALYEEAQQLETELAEAQH